LKYSKAAGARQTFWRKKLKSGGKLFRRNFNLYKYSTGSPEFFEKIKGEK
jgi:hypothetical protein